MLILRVISVTKRFYCMLKVTALIRLHVGTTNYSINKKANFRDKYLSLLVPPTYKD